MLAFDTAVSQKALFSEVSRRQRKALSRTRGGDGDALARRYLEMRRRVARHVINWQRGGKWSEEVDSDNVERMFKEIREIESFLLGSIQVGAESKKHEAVLARQIASELRRDEILLEFVRFMPCDMTALRSGQINSLVPYLDNSLQHYGVFVISGATGNITAIDLGAAKQIDDAVLHYRDIQQRQSAPASFSLDEEALAKAAEPLRHFLLDPVSAQLQASRRIYVAAVGQISLMPLEALTVSDANGNLRYLVEDHEVVYLATGRDLTRHARTERPTHSEEAWLFGDPDFESTHTEVAAAVGVVNGESEPGTKMAAKEGLLLAEPQQMAFSDRNGLGHWSRLERTRDLLLKISDAVHGSGMAPLVMTDAAASELNVSRIRAPRLVVFATHGRFLDRAPRLHLTLDSLVLSTQGSKTQGKTEGIDWEEWLAGDPLFRSMLVLAGANRTEKISDDSYAGDGLLTAYEIWGLDLDGTELVALAACETGLGVVQAEGGGSLGLRQPNGEVIAGLRQSFMVAGAKSIVMSMWQVPLNETLRLLGDFFDRWLRDKQNRYTAFHLSQLEALRYAREHRGTGHPFWWAGFVYAGDPGDH